MSAKASAALTGVSTIRTFFSLGLLLCFLGTAHAQDAKIERVDILGAGIYVASFDSKTQAPGTALGQRDLLSNIKLVEKTTHVEAKVGVRFGYEFKVVGSPQKGRVTLRSVTIYPEPGAKNPKTGNTTIRGEYARPTNLNVADWKGYTFDNEWEIVPGTWTFQLWDGDRKLASQSFEVVKAR